jgi:hypothetical protein
MRGGEFREHRHLGAVRAGRRSLHLPVRRSRRGRVLSRRSRGNAVKACGLTTLVDGFANGVESACGEFEAACQGDGRSGHDPVE